MFHYPTNGLLAWADPIIFFVILPAFVIISAILAINEFKAYLLEKERELLDDVKSWDEIISGESQDQALYYASGLIKSWCEDWSPMESENPVETCTRIFDELQVTPVFHQDGRIYDGCEWRRLQRKLKNS